MTKRTSDLILKAMEFAKMAHLGQKRDSGRDFFNAHCMPVYEHVKMERGGTNILAAALLHDVIEDTEYTYEDLRREFNDEIALIVLKLTQTQDNTFPLLHMKDGYTELEHMAEIIKHFDTSVNCAEMYTWNKKERMAYLLKKRAWLI